RGTIIVVERWDRLGRLRPDKQTELIAELLRTGVDIGVAALDDIFTETDFGTFKWAGLATFIMLAFQESLQKSDRSASVWAKRRQRAREEGRSMGGHKPAWLKIVNGAFVTVPERALAVRRIFALSADGYGQARIVATLDKEGIAPFG